MTFCSTRKNVAIAVLAVLGTVLGCNNMGTDSLNPQFMEVLGTPYAPVAPGTAPFVVIRVLNMTDHQVIFYISIEPANGEPIQPITANVNSGFDGGMALSCPIPRITLGDVTNRDATGALIVFDENTRQEIPALSKILRDGIDYFCGDLIVFAAIKDNSTVGGYSLIYGVLDGSGQPTSFTGPDTFNLLAREIAELLEIGIISIEQSLSGP